MRGAFKPMYQHLSRNAYQDMLAYGTAVRSVKLTLQEINSRKLFPRLFNLPVGVISRDNALYLREKKVRNIEKVISLTSRQTLGILINSKSILG